MKTPSDRTKLIAGATRRGGGRRPVNPPIERASTMLSDRAADLRDGSLGPTYGLDGGSAARELRATLAALEGAGEAWIVPSGLAAVTVPLAAIARPGDEIIASDGVYGPSRRFLTRWMSARGVTVRFHAAEADAATVAALFDEHTRAVLIESPASLTMDMLDAPALAAAARAKGVVSIMDNTWGAGLALKPLAHGVDISVQAVTKYASGHSDVLMGSIATSDAALGRAIDGTIEDMGWHVSPDDAWLALRGIRTLPLRMTEQARAALEVTTWLQARPEVARVLYPALSGDAGHALWARDYRGAASLFGLEMKGGTTASAQAFLDALSLFGLGYSWGGYESLATHETHQMAYRQQPPSLAGELLRFHVGLEDPADLIADLEVGLAAWRAAVRG
jgi:cystathionine beta-lyase